jgi:serine/threonine-protein kinase
MGGTPEPAVAGSVEHAETAAAPALAPSPDDPLIGRVLQGRYRVDAKIGAGGMGAVYRGEHVAIGKPVAIKVLHPRLGGSVEAGERFRREAFVGGKIGHANCVAVYDFGETEDGAFYLVMELLGGESLGDVLDREGRLPWRRALHIARHVLRGLGHAHDHGVVHRDIKPDNIFLARTEDDPDLAKLLDFGIAKLVGTGGATITQAGITVGTPAYLSPEQAFGSELDGRSDLYSLSVVLFEMLAGRTPFADRDLMAMLTAHAVADVPRIADVAPEADVPAGVEALVRDGLAKQPGDRVASAADYVARIDELLGRATIATPLPMAAVTIAPPAPTPNVSGVYAAPAVSLQHAAVSPPRDLRKLAMIGGGAVLVIGVVAALVTGGGDGDGGGAGARAASGATAAVAVPDAAPARPRAAEPKPAEPKPAEPKPAEPKAAEPKPAEPSLVEQAGAALVQTRDEQYKAAIAELTKGKTCEARKAAVARLRDLGDKRAIKPLKKARYRMRGGLLGIGDSNTNACLKKDAEAAAAALAKLP